MRNFFLTIVASMTVACPALAQTPASAPASSAYQGNVGDWALGRWTGYRYLDASFSRLVTEDRVLVVTKLPDGRVGCQWATPAELARSGWAPRCEITATSIALRTAANAEVQLDRDGVELEGRNLEVGARYKVHLHRGNEH